MKATKLLKDQHRSVEALFDELEGDAAEAPVLLGQLASELAGHMAIEQTIFYPAVRECDEELVADSFEEHAIAELALKRLMRAGASDDTFAAKLATLRELIENHVEEEERELFPEVERALGDERLEELGRQMAKAFELTQSEEFSSIVPEGFSRTSADEALKVGSRAADRSRRSHAPRQ